MSGNKMREEGHEERKARKEENKELQRKKEK